MPTAADARAQLKRSLSSVPLYRALPPGSLRSYAALHYYGDDSPDEVCDFLQASGEVPTRFFSTARIAAHAAFRKGRDELATEVLRDMCRRFPDIAEPHHLWAQLLWFLGQLPDALERAVQARLLEPTSESAVATTIRLSYQVEGLENADRTAVHAVRMFPASPAVLWAAAKECRTVEQFHRLLSARAEAVSGDRAIQVAVRPMSLAAARVGLIDEAIELYADGMLLHLTGAAPIWGRRQKRIEGKSPLRAVQDVMDVLSAMDVDYFFAAGTALGFVRDGGPLAHDADIDVGVFDRTWNPIAISEGFRRHPMFVTDAVHPRNEKVAAKHRFGTPIDVFRFYEEDGGYWHAGTFVRWRNSPFDISHRTIGHLRVPLPVDEERYLQENYGEWRVPDPDFDAFIDGPNAQIVWPEYRDLHLMRRAYQAFGVGDATRAVNDLHEAATSLDGSSSGERLLQVVEV